MKKPKDFDPEEFKKIARRLPPRCFKEAYQKSFLLATDPHADPFEMERFDLLGEVLKERKDL